MLRHRLTAAVLALSALAGAAAADPNARVKQGALQGVEADGVTVFSGVPYAAPPVGDLRWRPPAAAPAWEGVRDATKSGADCTKSEDCLFLNVTRPANAKAGAKLPVMVWIHGGAFLAGASERGFGAEHDGTEFAKKGAVVVTLNYRLGRAGWFAHPALTKEGPTGNYGLMDQVAALKWVQANIAAFGGDPKNVTVFGESAGGISTLLLMLAPDAKGLFQKAIIESGFPRMDPTPLATAEAAGLKAAEAAGVKGDGAEAAAALRKLPLTAMPYSGPFTSRAGPILDGKMVQSGITQGFAAGRQMKIPLVLGGNSNEASLFRPTAAQLEAMPAPVREGAIKAFDDGTGDKTRIVHRLVTAQFMTEPNRNLARIHAKAGQPTYLYYFSYVPEAKRATSLGAGHVDEIRYVFGGPKQKFAADEVPISNAVNAYWAAFARRGVPGAAGGVAWPAFTPANEATLEFGVDGVAVRKDHQKAALDVVEAIQPK